MTFNLRVNTPIDGDNAWPYRIRHAADLVRKAEPLIIGTQEGRYDMLRDLDRELPEYSRLGEGRSGYESGDPRMDECCAIFYRKDLFKVIRHGQFSLSETPEIPASVSWDSSYPRFCTWACLERIDEPGRRFYVYNTHFDHESQLAREESAKLLLDRIARCQEEEGLPVLLTGDFNSFPDNPAIVTLRQNLVDAFLAHQSRSAEPSMISKAESKASRSTICSSPGTFPSWKRPFIGMNMKGSTLPTIIRSRLECCSIGSRKTLIGQSVGLSRFFTVCRDSDHGLILVVPRSNSSISALISLSCSRWSQPKGDPR